MNYLINIKYFLISLLLVINFSSCKNEKGTNARIEVSFDSIRNDTSVVLSIVESKVDVKNCDSSFKRKYNISEEEKLLKNEFKNFKLFDLTHALTEDFNGDGKIDSAFFLTENEKSGIIIKDGLTNREFRIGLGNTFEEMGDDFNWIDYWGIVKDSSTYEIVIEDGEIVGDTIVTLNIPSIILRKVEEGGGLISFKGGKYVWIHQAE